MSQTTALRPRPSESRANLYQEITDKIVAELEAGRVPWVQPWGTTAKAGLGLPKNVATGRRYSGINVLILWGAVVERGFSCQGWLNSAAGLPCPDQLAAARQRLTGDALTAALAAIRSEQRAAEAALRLELAGTARQRRIAILAAARAQRKPPVESYDLLRQRSPPRRALRPRRRFRARIAPSPRI